MKKISILLLFIISSLSSKSQDNVYTFVIEPDTSIIVSYNKMNNDTTISIARYFQFQVIGADADSVTIQWYLIKDNGEGVKDNGVKKLPIAVLAFIKNDIIDLNGLNQILAQWGLYAWYRKLI